MLVFISDLHFVDETAGKHNIRTRAFKGAFEDLKKYSGKPFRGKDNISWGHIRYKQDNLLA